MVQGCTLVTASKPPMPRAAASAWLVFAPIVVAIGVAIADADHGVVGSVGAILVLHNASARVVGASEPNPAYKKSMFLISHLCGFPIRQLGGSMPQFREWDEGEVVVVVPRSRRSAHGLYASMTSLLLFASPLPWCVPAEVSPILGHTQGCTPVFPKMRVPQWEWTGVAVS